MRFARCECAKCGEIMIEFKNNFPPYRLVCPLCGCNDSTFKYIWIDRNNIE